MKGGISAALLTLLIVAGHQAPAARASAPAHDLASGETVLHSGLTVAVRRAPQSPTAALQIWVRCPSDGYAAPRPGIARLTAIALVERKSGGSSLRDIVRAEGGNVTISIFPTAAEISVGVPAYVAPAVAQALTARLRQPAIDRQSFDAAKLLLSVQQAESSALADLVLRDALFGQLFSSGPFHYSTYGDAKTLSGLSLAEVQSFAASAFVPANEMLVGVGDLDLREFARRASALNVAGRSPLPMPPSMRAQNPRVAEAAAQGPSGIVLGWFGPPISDQLAATAMDFLSDYLTRPHYGELAKAAEAAAPGADFNGQFITLRDSGVFYVSIAGNLSDAKLMAARVQSSIKRLRSAALPDPEFQQMIEAFRTHMLRDTQTPQQLADNFGWYFVQGSAAYTPSVAGEELGGDYFREVAALTPRFVYQTASKYLSAPPAVVLVGRPPVPKPR